MNGQSVDRPTVACLCPTYRRPRLLENAIACFLAQDYPADRRRLLILDDAGELSPQSGNGWEVFFTAVRFPTLPAKFNALTQLAGDADVLAVWEDDDIYLPWHLSESVAAMVNTGWSHPSRVLSTYGDTLHEEPAGGRFHASLVIRRECLKAVGGWPSTARADFDQQLIARLASTGPYGDPTYPRGPSYVFRWGSTLAYHGQHGMRGADDEAWYNRAVEKTTLSPCDRLDPRMGRETVEILESLAKGV
jgi:hypothetical protein